MTQATPGPAPAEASRRHESQVFWTLAVALPAALSLLRLWIEAGGQFQTTLLLVQNVNAVNLFATTLLVSMRLVSGVLVLAFAVGGVLVRSADANGAPERLPLLARWTRRTPLWLLGVVFGLALATWQILYLPLLLPAFVLVFQSVPEWGRIKRWQRSAASAAVLSVYAGLLTPTAVDAARQGEYFVFGMFVVPPLLALGVDGPVPRWFAGVLAVAGQIGVVLFAVAAAATTMTMPVLPLTVTTVRDTDGSSTNLRGYVVGTDDELTAILQESGGVRYVHNDAITARTLCPASPDLPVYRLRVHDLHIEDSLLEAWGRRVRPAPTIDATCRVLQSPRTAGPP
ncbi:hypothetical protein [Cryptosporangium aurantiacum]|uniref:Uncharacterized protein n=1 Tax=Cryptosporangium aurantiacum TaxID=134849 RepID=A0A1M7RI79_9ACTN|nr:hypothetical protein [Cryptosporangium aurantiacum]SHN45872.1 hypothetical protein SAMN05443668_11360 [Cryptosporangium aurantiacum]